ncbi:matrix-remodeling-associated protein 7-like isoform X4 [Amphibalanus amphitrite]|nr:matrix-remodeling-associated protein 7-like isoform X4 [Amphibalanus amphitrite]
MDFNESIIEAVRKYPGLWDKKSKDYAKKKTVKDLDWQRVAAECRCDVQAAKERWKSLRDYYLARKRKTLPSGSAAPAGGHQHLGPYGNMLRFLDPSTQRGPESVMTGAAGGGAGEFSSAWTLAEAAARDPFHLGQFFALLWGNTSGYLLAACLVSVAAVLLSWVYMVRGAGPARGPDQRTGGPSEDRSSPATRSPTKTSCCSPAAADDADDASDDADSASADAAAVPPPPPEEEEELGSSEEGGGGVPDLVEMAHHLPARMKQAELRHIRQKLQSDMTEEQRRRERQVERDQMTAIMELMQKNSDKFGSPSLDDMQAQLKLYM